MANNDFDLPRPTDPVPSSSSIVANDNSKVLDYLVNGTGTVVTRTGKIVPTLDKVLSGLTLDALGYAPTPVNGGIWASGQIFNFYNEYMIYNGEAYSPLPATTLSYTVGATPDLGFVYQIQLNDHSKLSNRNAAEAHVASAITNSDGLTAQDTHDATKANLISQGLSGNYGFFTKGFTYVNSGDVGIKADGSTWRYTGALPHVVTAGTVPSSPDYEQISLQDHNSTTNREAKNAHQQYREEATIADVESGAFDVGTKLILTDRGMALFDVTNLAPYVVTGYDILYAGDGKAAVLVRDISFINVEHMGASPSVIDNLPILNRAHEIAGAVDSIYIPSFTLGISDTFTLTKIIKLYGDDPVSSVIKNNGTGDGVVFSGDFGQSMIGVRVDGNESSGHGVVIDGNHFYGERFGAEANGGDGVFITPNHWVIKLRNLFIFNNEGNGINAVATSFESGQVNNIGIHGCTIWLNGKSGILANVLALDVSEQNLIEGNGRFGVEFTSEQHVALGGMAVHNNYMEANHMGDIGYTLGDQNISNTQVYENIMILEDPTSTLPSHIEANLATGYTNGRIDNITVRDNVYISSFGVRHVNLNNLTVRNCGGEIKTVDIPDLDWSYYYINIGEMRLSVSPKERVISGSSNSTGDFTYTSPNRTAFSDNILPSGVGVPKKQSFDSLLTVSEIPTKVSFNLSYVGSSCQVRISLYYVNNRTGASTLKTTQSLGPYAGAAFVESGWFAAYVIPETLRLKSEERMYIEIEVTNMDASATSLSVGNPILKFL